MGPFPPQFSREVTCGQVGAARHAVVSQLSKEQREGSMLP